MMLGRYGDGVDGYAPVDQLVCKRLRCLVQRSLPAAYATSRVIGARCCSEIIKTNRIPNGAAADADSVKKSLEVTADALPPPPLGGDRLY
jgi:hypothetical protein